MELKTASFAAGCLYLLVWLIGLAVSLAIPTLIVLALLKYIRS